MSEDSTIDYPAYMRGGDHVTARLRASYARISRQVDANVALEKERIAALEWCRANGNPHLAKGAPDHE